MKKRTKTAGLSTFRSDKAVDARVVMLTEGTLAQVRGGGGPEGPDPTPPPTSPDPEPPAASKPK
jgi:hypothetical protein